MATTRREFLRGTVGMAVARKLSATSSWPFFLTDAESPYGSGNFGRWTEDEFGLPAFVYNLNQTTDARAVTNVQPGVLSPTEHIHQVGNDRITAIASNYGHVRVRQDEGCPKFLNDVDPTSSQFGGGLGYLIGPQETLTTYYDGSNRAFERIFGVGYYRKTVSGSHYSVDQVIAAPFGDDPALISQVTITNHGGHPGDVRWIEYWGCQPYQFSFRAAINAMASKTTATEWRRDLGRRFRHQMTQIAQGRGLLESKHFIGRSHDEESAWQRGKAALRAYPYGFYSPVEVPNPGTDFESVDLPQTFLVSLDGPVSAFSADAASFFGEAGAASPAGLAQPLDSKLGDNQTALFLERTAHLAPKGTTTFTFLYGYLAEGFSLDLLLAKYERSHDAILRDSAAAWKNHGMRFDVPAEPWVKREATWNHYYLRSSQTYDDFFGEHILNQNGFYQYTMGFQGAARDPLQHALPFVFSDPAIVKSILRYTLKEVRDDGSLPYGIVGHGVIAPMLSDKASDLPLWLLWIASEYILATRDVDFLSEQIPAHLSATPGRTTRVSELLERCYRHQVNDVGAGQHGVMRMLVDDWNDGLIYTWARTAMKECIDQSESVLNSAMAAWVYDYYARMLDYAGNGAPLSGELRTAADKHRQATQAQWNGKWFRRAWLGPKLGWLGDTTLWIEPQPWAILSGAATEAQTRDLVRTIDDELRRGPLGAAQMSDGPDMRSQGGDDLGTLEMGAIWPSLNQTLVWALANLDPAMAWDEWKRNSLAVHAESYPDIWYGVWSGNDSYNSPLNKRPGRAANVQYFRGEDFPVLNLHSHACSLYSATKLLGIDFTPNGMNVSPKLPIESYRFDSTLVGVVRSAGRFEGWYAPQRPGHWTIEIALPKDLAVSIKAAEVNGKRSPALKKSNEVIEISGPSAPGKPLRWILT